MKPKTEKFTRIGKPQLDLLEKLTNANGVSGNEHEIREIIRGEVKPYADEIITDAMGNLLVTRHAKTQKPLKIMMAAHMDEVGFMVVAADEEGLFSFTKVGGIDDRQLLSKSVVVGDEKISAMIGGKPIHLAENGELHEKVSHQNMRIDVGSANKERVKIGDYAAFATKFCRSGDTLFAKALDDRLGVATLIELIKHLPENIEFMAAFTVQEEIGLRGARVAAYRFVPDVAIVVDSTPAFDMERPDELENSQYNCRLDAGPAIYIADAGTLSDPRLIRFLTQTAESNQIPYQFRQPGGGGTDAGSIHVTHGGIPTVSVSVPGRYAHTPILVSRIKDWENTILLLQKALETIDSSILAEERP